MFYIRMGMEEVQSTSQIVELSGKIRVLLSELPLTVKNDIDFWTIQKVSYPCG